MMEHASIVILLTAFEPFGGDELNPTEMALENLPVETGGFSVRKILLPVEFVRAREIAFAAYDECRPAAVLMFGQAGGRSAITPETTAKNVMNARIPDNAGFRPEGLAVVEGGPETLPSTLPVDLIVEALRAEGILCETSDDAGAYVCNALFYGMLEHSKGTVPAGFIHVPYVPEQGHPDKPFMEMEDVIRGMRISLETVASFLAHQSDKQPEKFCF